MHDYISECLPWQEEKEARTRLIAHTVGEPVKMFKHSSLNLNNTSTIRLVEILPFDGTDVTQCKIRHATIAADYTCLSYVWGSSDDTQEILIDGRRFKVRRNLADFMKVMRFKEPIQQEGDDSNDDARGNSN
jgi:hypothetical protein